MTTYTRQAIIDSIRNGKEDILFYVTSTYFQTCRRLLRRAGCRDADTPSVFSKALVKVYREIQKNKISPNIDFEKYLINSVEDYFRNQYAADEVNSEISQSTEKDIIASCYSILDESSRKLLSMRYVENLTFEQIASRMNYSNPFIAEFEFDKAFEQLSSISKARLQITIEE